MRSRRRHILFALITTVGAAGIALTLAEAAARLLYRGPLVTGSLIVADPELGFALRPGSCGRGVSPEFDVRYFIDRRLGVRTAEMAAQLPSAADLVVHGDSFVFGHGVEHDEVFTSLLAAKSPGTTIVNAGVFNYGPDQEFLWARRLRAEFPAALEWACSFEDNDIGDVTRYGLLQVTENGLRQQSPRDSVGPWRRRLTGLRFYPWLCRSWLWGWAKHVLVDSTMQAEPAAAADAVRSGQDPVRLLVSLYTRWQQEVGADRFRVVFIPARDHFRRPRADVDRLKRELQAAGIQFCDLAGAMDAAAPARFEAGYYERDEHWNPAGHAWAAGNLEPVLRKMRAAAEPRAGWTAKP